jgi:hypothetical protein
VRTLRIAFVLGSWALVASCSTSSDGGGERPASDGGTPSIERPSDGGASADGNAPESGDGAAQPTTGYDSMSFATDGSGIGGATGAPFVFDAAKRYADDAAFRKNVANYGQSPGNPLVAPFDPAKAGTGTAASALYGDGRNPDLADWSPNAGPTGDPAFVFTIKALDEPGESPTPELAVGAKGKHSVWLWVRRRYEPGFSAYGDADDVNGAQSWNQTQGSGLKIGPYAAYGYHDSLANTTYYGRAGLQTGNGAADSTADYDLVNLPQGSPQPAGVNDTIIGKVTTEWTDGLWRDYLVYIGNTLDGDGMVRVAAQAWVRKLDGGAFVPIGGRLSGVIGPATGFERPRFDQIAPIMLNANHARKTDEHFQLWGWAAFDAEAVPDPYGVLGP